MGMKYKEINGLKGCLAVCIVIYHYFGIEGFANGDQNAVLFYPVLSPFYQYGYIAVEVFFMITGFLMANSYLGNYDSKFLQMDFSQYCFHKFRYLIPLAQIPGVIIILYGVVVDRWLTNNAVVPSFTIFDAYKNLFFCGFTFFSFGGGLTNYWNGITWYLEILLPCYVLFYVLIKNISKGKQGSILLLSSAFVGLGIVLNVTAEALWQVAWGRGLYSFFLGILIWYIVKRNTKAKNTFLGEILAVNCTLLYMAWILQVNIFDNAEYIGQYIVAPSVLFASINLPILKRILQSRSLQKLGNISRALFLTQFIVFKLVDSLHKGIFPNIDFHMKKIFGINMILIWIVALSFQKISVYVMRGLDWLYCKYQFDDKGDETENI